MLMTPFLHVEDSTMGAVVSIGEGVGEAELTAAQSSEENETKDG